MYAVRVFNPFFIQQNSIPTLTLMVHELKHFGKGFPEFSDENFKSLLISQLVNLKTMSQVPFDWESMESSKQYNMRKMKKKQHDLKRNMLQQIDGLQITVGETLGKLQEYEDWKDDPVKLAKRIVGWWQSMKMNNPKLISGWLEALVLVLLVQTSSCSVERIFSQLQYIRRSCGPKMLESTLELRTLLRCQHGKGDDFEI